MRSAMVMASDCSTKSKDRELSFGKHVIEEGIDNRCEFEQDSFSRSKDKKFWALSSDWIRSGRGVLVSSCCFQACHTPYFAESVLRMFLCAIR